MKIFIKRISRNGNRQNNNDENIEQVFKHLPVHFFGYDENGEWYVVKEDFYGQWKPLSNEQWKNFLRRTNVIKKGVCKLEAIDKVTVEKRTKRQVQLLAIV